MKKQASEDLEHAKLKSIAPAAAANCLDVSERTLAKWRSLGYPNIPYIKVGRCVRYKIIDLEAYLAKHTVNGLEG